MEFLTFIGKVKGSNHWKETFKGKDNRRQYQGWRVLPCEVPVAAMPIVDNAAVEVPVAAMPIVVPVDNAERCCRSACGCNAYCCTSQQR